MSARRERSVRLGLRAETSAAPRKRTKKENELVKDDGGAEVSMEDETKDALNGEFSAYELKRLENIRRNEKYLSNLGLEEVKVSLEAAASEKKATKRGASTKKLSFVELPRRRSGRVTVEKLRAELQELQSNNPEKMEEIERKKSELEEMVSQRYDNSYAAVIDSGGQIESNELIGKDPISLEDWKNKETDTPMVEANHVSKILTGPSSVDCKSVVKSNSIEYNKNIKELTMQESDVAKITRSRITSVFLHPTVDKILVAAGDKDGYVGLWDVDNFTAGNDGVYMYRIHNSNVTRLHCFQQDPWKIYSSSYDGTIRCLDVHANAFVVAFDAPDSDGNTFTSDCYFLSSNASCALIGKSDGQVALVDMRASNRTYQWEHFAQMQNAKINSVQEHPTESHLIVSAGSGKAGCLRVHDLRKAGKGWKPLVEMNEHSKSINAAYVSTNGEYLVSVALDDTVRTWRNFISPGVKPSCEVKRRDNHTGRWLSTFRPVFDPKSATCFALGSMQRQRVVEVFEIAPSGGGGGGGGGPPSLDAAPVTKLVRQLASDYLQSVCSRNAFHPHLNVFAGGNSSGRVHIFRNKR